MARAETVISPALRQFSRTGKLDPGLTDQAVAELITSTAVQLTQTDVPAALRWSRQLIRRAEGANRLVALAIWRANGRAALMAAAYSEAAAAYLKAKRFCAADKIAAARIDRTLIDVYMYLGEYTKSRQCAARARAVFRAAREQAELARTDVNYANLLHRQDRHAEAQQLYADAGAYFLSVGDALSAARCQYNQANTLVQLFEFTSAQKLYQTAGDVYRQAGYQLDALDADWGIAWMHLLAGEYHLALRELHTCETAYRQHGRSLRVVACLLDRSEIALTLQLHHEALQAAADAAVAARQLRLGYEQGKGELFRTAALIALGQRTGARKSMTRARALLVREKNQGFLGAADLIDSQLQSAVEGRKRLLRSAARRFSSAQLPLWQAMTDLQASEIPALANQAIARLRKSSAAKASPHIYASLRRVEGDIAWREGKPKAALANWRAAAARIDQVRLQLPPIGIAGSERTITGVHGRLVESLASSNPLEALGWSERRKTSGIWQPVIEDQAAFAVRNQIEQSLGSLAAQVSQYRSQLSSSGERTIRPGRHGAARIERLQRQIRSELLQIESTARAAVQPVDELVRRYLRQSHELPIIHLHASHTDLIFFRVVSGDVTTLRIPDGRNRARRLMSQLGFFLDQSAYNPSTRRADIFEEERFFSLAAEWLWKPLEIAETTKSALLLIEGELAHFPWGALRVGDRALLEHHRFVQAPSFRHFELSMKRSAPSEGLCLFQGKGDDLEHVAEEAAAIRACCGRLIAHPIPCTRSDIAQAPSSRYWHYSGHAVLHRQNPFYTALPLADGPYFAADFRLRQVPVGLVTLAACQSGVDPALPGNETSGLVRSLLEMGARQVVAGHWHVSDRSTADWMRRFYRILQNDPSAATALQQASLEVRETSPAVYHWGSFALFGAAV